MAAKTQRFIMFPSLCNANRLSKQLTAPRHRVRNCLPLPIQTARPVTALPPPRVLGTLKCGNFSELNRGVFGGAQTTYRPSTPCPQLLTAPHTNGPPRHRPPASPAFLERSNVETSRNWTVVFRWAQTTYRPSTPRPQLLTAPHINGPPRHRPPASRRSWNAQMWELLGIEPWCFRRGTHRGVGPRQCNNAITNASCCQTDSTGKLRPRHTSVLHGLALAPIVAIWKWQIDFRETARCTFATSGVSSGEPTWPAQSGKTRHTSAKRGKTRQGLRSLQLEMANRVP